MTRPVYDVLAAMLIGDHHPGDPDTAAGDLDRRAATFDALNVDETDPARHAAGTALADQARRKARQLRRGGAA